MLRKIIFSLLICVFLYEMIYCENLADCRGVIDGEYLVDPNNCLSYIYCNESFAESAKADCPNLTPYFTTNFECSKNASECDVGVKRPIPSDPITNNTSTNNTITFSECPSVDDPNNLVFLPNNKSCSEYYACYHGQAIPMHCSNNLHFDMKQNRCDTAQNVQCQMDSVSPREQCTSHTVDVYPHTHNCNYYYKCELGYLMIMQCPFNEGWDYEKRVCVMMPKAKCYDALHRDE